MIGRKRSVLFLLWYKGALYKWHLQPYKKGTKSEKIRGIKIRYSLQRIILN